MAKPEWDKQQVTQFVREAISQVGRDGWALLVPQLRVALIRSQALTVVASQARSTVRVSDVRALEAAMLNAAGLD